MFQYIEDWLTRRRVKKFLAKDPLYLLSDEQHERWQFLRDHPGYLGMAPIAHGAETFDKVEGLDPLNAPKNVEEFYQQIDNDDPWTWDRVKRTKEIKVIDKITTT